MIVVGLTGSIAMGKSTAAKMLAEMDGVAVFCSDEAVKRLYKDPEVIELIRRRFPSSYDGKTGGIDKKNLIAEIGFDHEKWDDLEAILHPFVRREQDKFLRLQQVAGTKIAVLDIPLLFETGAQERVDYTICVTASRVPAASRIIQEQRIAERIREGVITEESFRFRLERQMPDEEKQAKADFIVPTGGGFDYTKDELQGIVSTLKKDLGNGHEHRRFPPHKL